MAWENWTGLIGTVVGGVLVMGGNALQLWLSERRHSNLATARKKYLHGMLKAAAGDGWMTIETLSRVVGAGFDETRRLLIEIDARGSLGDKEVWSLISRNPLPNVDEGEGAR